ncbi:MAG: TonB family protein [Pseudomonadota bacterium]
MAAGGEILAPPQRLTRRRSDGQEGRLTRDRLTTMLVLAALLHGLVILGISFTGPGSGKGEANHGLEVLLVPDELPEAQRNDTANYLAQRTQLGSGNTKERLPAQLPSERGQPVPPGSRNARPSGDVSQQVLATTRDTRTHIQMLPLPPAMVQLTDAERVELEAEAARAGDEELRLRGDTRDQYYLSADTRASPFAPYLDGWRRRVERIGTVNYPNAARRDGLTGSPTIEVVIERDGKLRSARIQHSSGHAEIDEAALNILRLASPFDPFSPALARDYQSLRFAYEWQFEGGQPKGSVISVP